MLMPISRQMFRLALEKAVPGIQIERCNNDKCSKNLYIRTLNFEGQAIIGSYLSHS